MSATQLKKIDKQISALLARKNEIKKINAAFSRMTAAERRVAIARDVIDQIDAEKYRLGSCGYIEDLKSNEDIDTLINDADTLKEVQVCDVINSMDSCQVCARGAMTLSAIRKFNKVTLDKFNPIEMSLSSDELEPIEDRFFSRKQTALIEHAYEGFEEAESDAITDLEASAAARYGYSLGDDRDCRLKAIMRNIIRNNGQFVIPKKFL